MRIIGLMLALTLVGCSSATEPDAPAEVCELTHPDGEIVCRPAETPIL